MDLWEHSFLMQILLLVAAAAVFLWLRRWRTGRLHAAAVWPPGPPAWPVVGHLHLLGDLPHQSLGKLSKIYGPLMGLRLGGVPTVVASSPEMAREVLQTNDLAFANRPQSAAAAHMCFNSSDIGFTPYGPVLKRMRQLFASEFFNAKRVASSRSVRDEEMRALMKQAVELGEGGRQALEVRRGLMTASKNVICRMVMSKKLEELSVQNGWADVTSLVEEIALLLLVFNVGDYIPWLRWLDLQGYVRRMKAAGQGVKELMQEVLRQRRREPPRVSPEDILDVLLAASADCSHGVLLTEENIMGLLLDFLIGGSEASAVTVEWALAELITNPEKQRKLQDELDTVAGNSRLVSEDDVQNLPYLTCVLKETMRLHPIASLLLQRESTKECKVGPYTIPAGTRVYVNGWTICRDPSVWDRPLEFLPERFDGNSRDLRGKGFDLLPFGRGRRGCPGWAFGTLSVHMMLAILVHSFDWAAVAAGSSSDAKPFVDMSDKFGLVTKMATPLRAFATPRLPAHLY